MAHDTYCESVLKWGIYPWSYGHKSGKSRGNMMMPTVDPDFLFPQVFIWCSHLWDHPVIPIPIITITTCPRNAADRTWHNSRRFLGRPIHVGCCDGKSGLKVFHNKMWISTILTKSGLVTRLKYFNMLKYLLTYILTYLKMDISDIGPLLVIGGIVVICHVSIEPWDWRVHRWMLTRPRVEDSKIWIGLSETMLPENPMVWQQVDIWWYLSFLDRLDLFKRQGGTFICYFLLVSHRLSSSTKSPYRLNAISWNCNAPPRA